MFIQKNIVLVMLSLMYLLAFIIQWHSLLNWDVSLLMHTAERFFQGGKYGSAFFDTDPPLILYIYFIPVLFARYLYLSLATANILFTFFISGTMLLLCYRMLSLLNKNYPATLLICAIAFTFLFIPAMNFAQREHIMLMLIMPYLLLTTARLYKINFNRYITFCIGLIAGCGFAIKPHFYLIFLIIEIYYCVMRGKLALRLESVTIIGFALLYLMSIVLFSPEYITIILPAINHYYYPGLAKIMWPLLVWTHPGLVLSLLPLGLYFICHHKTFHLENIFILATLGFIIVYLLQKTYWYYHLIPAFSLSFILLTQLCYRISKPLWDQERKTITILSLTILCIVYFPGKYIYALNAEAMHARCKADVADLMHILPSLPKNTSIYFLSGCLLPYPAVDYLHLQDVQLAQTYWFLPGMVLKGKTQEVAYEKALDLIHKNILLQKIILDLLQKNPTIIVVDNRINCNGIAFQFIPFFSKDNTFKQFFSNYDSIAHFATIDIYQKHLAH